MRAPSQNVSETFHPAAEAHPPVDLLLKLAAAQIVESLTEANVAFDALGSNVLELARHADGHATCEVTYQALHQLQAIDRLQQRLGNVERTLGSLATMLSTTDQRPTSADWSSLVALVRSRYTTEAERVLFDNLIRTA